MKSIIELNDTGKEIRLIKRISSNNELDGMKLKTIGKGFIPYLMYQDEQRINLKSLGNNNKMKLFQTKSGLFQTYFEKCFKNFDIGECSDFRPEDDETKEKFIKNHIKTEQKYFEQIPAEYKSKRTDLFTEYLKWIKDKTVQPKKRFLADIALQYIWEGKIINTQNKDQVAASFPEQNLKNGDKLIQKFNHYNHQTNRVNDNGIDHTNQNHLEDMNRALSFLKNPDHIKTAEKEIVTFKRQVKEVSGQIL